MAAQATMAVAETSLRAAVAERIGESRFGLWFGEGVHLGVAGDALEVGVPNAFFREWIRGHFAGNLIEAAHAVTGRSLRLRFHVADEAEPPLGHVVSPLPAPDHRPGGGDDHPTIPLPSPPADRPRAQSAPAPSVTPPPPGRPARRLEDFVTGPGNRLAHAAAIELIQAGGASFNPLVITGGTGLGKTHLLEGIGAALRARHPGLRVVQITAESFTNGFLDAMRHGTLTAFRAKYRGAGALLVDDVHFLAAKKATQDEFLHTFNALVADGVPIVLTADHHPRQIAKLSDELATRFLGGMVVRLDAPDPATRKAILQAKAAARGVSVPDAVLSYVAEHLRASVRELEGALHSLLAHALLAGKRLDLPLAKVALRDTIRHTARSVALKDVERVVCQLFSIEPDALKADNRARAIAYPRMLAMHLARRHTGAAYSEIGRFFGNRNHSTVISAEKKVEGWLRDEARNGILPGFETMGDILHALERSLGA
ncbi:chromosomal replication initiator protein DnaA [Tundrisphaera sp. TA3]|uniref:chromosomal replication initiator protein DnaA n=1 Tax=Tundrisphaera sp. TA3 TaxID=3435775 RepID=UPI003EBB2829